MVEERSASDDIQVVGERNHLRAAEWDVLERDAYKVVAEFGCVVLLHYININMNEVIYVVESDYAVAFEYNLLAGVLEAGRKSEHRSDVAEFLVNLERSARRLGDSDLQCARVVVERDVERVPERVQFSYKCSCIISARGERLCEGNTAAVYAECVGERADVIRRVTYNAVHRSNALDAGYKIGQIVSELLSDAALTLGRIYEYVRLVIN